MAEQEPLKLWVSGSNPLYPVSMQYVGVIMDKLTTISKIFVDTLAQVTKYTYDVQVLRYESKRSQTDGTTSVNVIVGIYQYDDTNDYTPYLTQSAKQMLSDMGVVDVDIIRSVDIYDDYVKYQFEIMYEDLRTQYTRTLNWNLSADEIKIIELLFSFHTMWGDDFDKYGGSYKWKVLQSLIKKGFVTYDRDDDNEGSIDFSRNVMNAINDNLPVPDWFTNLVKRHWEE